MGVGGGRVETRIANAEHDSTYLLAKVEVVATYKLAGINRTRIITSKRSSLEEIDEILLAGLEKIGICVVFRDNSPGKTSIGIPAKQCNSLFVKGKSSEL
jgi:hypothetical protein